MLMPMSMCESGTKKKEERNESMEGSRVLIDKPREQRV
jgi:hypothetical protein